MRSTATFYEPSILPTPHASYVESCPPAAPPTVRKPLASSTARSRAASPGGTRHTTRCGRICTIMSRSFASQFQGRDPYTQIPYLAGSSGHAFSSTRIHKFRYTGADSNRSSSQSNAVFRPSSRLMRCAISRARRFTSSLERLVMARITVLSITASFEKGHPLRDGIHCLHRNKKSPEIFQDLIQHHTKRRIISLYLFPHICKNVFVTICLGRERCMIPTCFSDYCSKIPLLNEVAEWSLLRKWALSEVYRVKLTTGESRIIKWGGSEMAGEAGIYRNLVHPLQIKAPQIFEFVQLKDSGVMIMEDVGEKNLEQQPHPAHFLEASRELARLRVSATANLERMLSKKVIDTYSVSMEHFLELLDDLLKSKKLAEAEVLLKLKKVLPRHLERLYQSVPTSIVHHDYHAKNLLIQDNGIMPIDWSIAYLSPHLGDLYCLITEAQAWSNLSREEMISAYLDVTDLQIDHLNWQVQIGGLCWLIKTLRWLVYGGTDIIPGSETWIPDLLKDVKNLYLEIV